jgi:HPt (histidine-containing phosphotransfer) domain-containing protein
MQSGLDHGNFEPVVTLGHQLCGAGGMFGFDRLTQIGAALECAGHDADRACAQIWLNTMTTCLNGIEINHDF